jgi:hypothetical protein
MTPLLFADLPKQRAADAPGAAVPVIRCGVCQSTEWIRCKPGTASLAERDRGSSSVAVLRSDDGEPMEAWCAEHDPSLRT